MYLLNFFPPKDLIKEESLWKNLRRLEPLKPQFVSVTYGAGGSTRDRTHKLVKQQNIKPTLNQQHTLHAWVHQ